MNTHFRLMVAKCLACLCLLGLPWMAHAQSRFVISADGAEVTDTDTGLIWKRCVEGHVWNGITCDGNSASEHWEDALKRANTGGGGWRLPSVKELLSIVDFNKFEPTIDSNVFPRTPVSNFWTSTPFASFNDYAWAVSFQFGSATMWPMDVGFRMRFVRTP